VTSGRSVHLFRVELRGRGQVPEKRLSALVLSIAFLKANRRRNHESNEFTRPDHCAVAAWKQQMC